MVNLSVWYTNIHGSIPGCYMDFISINIGAKAIISGNVCSQAITVVLEQVNKKGINKDDVKKVRAKKV